jgi:hypothetical protein
VRFEHDDAPLVRYLEFVGAQGARNTWLAVSCDLNVFFEVVARQPAEVTAADVFAFLSAGYCKPLLRSGRPR